MEKEPTSSLMDHIIRVILRRMRLKIRKEFLNPNSYNILEDSYKTDLKGTDMKKELHILLLVNMKKESGLEGHLNG